jgi:Uma2 family endonuclease
MVSQPVTFRSNENGAVPDDLIFRLTVEQYHQMIRAGVLASGTPIELLEGWLVVKMTKNPSHRVATGLIRRALEAIIPSGWFVDSQEPITTADSEPEPDISVVKGTVRDYSDHHPGPQDATLVVEVADSSLRRDKITKKRLYARAGVTVYWIVNLVDGLIEVYSDPSGPADQPDYRHCQVHTREDEVPVKLAGREVGRLAVRDLLP